MLTISAEDMLWEDLKLSHNNEYLTFTETEKVGEAFKSTVCMMQYRSRLSPAVLSVVWALKGLATILILRSLPELVTGGRSSC